MGRGWNEWSGSAVFPAAGKNAGKPVPLGRATASSSFFPATATIPPPEFKRSCEQFLPPPRCVAGREVKEEWNNTWGGLVIILQPLSKYQGPSPLFFFFFPKPEWPLNGYEWRGRRRGGGGRCKKRRGVS